MKKIWVSIAMITVLMLGACSGDKKESSGQGTVNDGEESSGFGSIDHGVDENKVGFSLSGDTVEEAAGVPAIEKELIMEAFANYIDAFNEKDIDRYLETLSEHTESFDKEEERAYMTDEVFNQFNLNRVASDVTIVKYSEKEAQVFARLETATKQISTGLEINDNGRQVTVFTKEDSEWKVSSVYYIGDSNNG